MKESGILFTPENHRLILSGAKVQTRRVIKPQPMTGQIWGDVEESEDYPYEWFQWFNGGEKSPTFTCPHGIPGNKLYIKEGVIISKAFNPPALSGYYMDGCRVEYPEQKRLTAMFMAKRYARTWMELTDVRVERLQDISAEDALSEGISKTDFWKPKEVEGRPFEEKWWDDHEFWQRYPQIAYSKLWDSINKKKYPWENNPWVWCLSFRKI